MKTGKELVDNELHRVTTLKETAILVVKNAKEDLAVAEKELSQLEKIESQLKKDKDKLK